MAEAESSMNGHRGMVLATCFDESGTYLYSVSDEGTINVWNVADASRAHVWQIHDGVINDLKYVDGQLFTAGFDRCIRVLDARTGAQALELRGHTAGVHAVAVSDNLIASGSADGRVGLWDRHTGDRLAWFTGHQNAVTCVAFLSRRRIISGSRDFTLRIWDVETRAEFAVLKGHRYWVTKVAALDGHTAVSIGEDGTLRVWDCESASELRMIEAMDVAWGLGIDDARASAIVSGSDTVHVVLSDGVYRKLANNRTSRGISIHPHGTLAALGNDDGQITLYDLDQDRVRATLQGDNAGVMSASSGSEQVVVGLTNGDLEVHTAAGHRTIERAHRSHIYAARTLDSARFVTGAFDGAIRIRDFGTLDIEQEFQHGSLVFSLSSPADLTTLLSGGGGGLNLWDLASGECIWSADGMGGHVMAAIDDTGSLIAAADTRLYLWQVGEWRQTTWELTGEMVSSIEFFSGGGQVAIGFADGTVGMSDVRDGSFVRLHNEHEDWLRTLRISLDGRLVLSVSQNGVGRVYDRAKRQVVSRIAQEPIRAADFDAAGDVRWIDARGMCHTAKSRPD